MTALTFLLGMLCGLAAAVVWGACVLSGRTHNRLRDPAATAAIRREILGKLKARMR